MTPDQLHMSRALELAQFQYGRTGANPSVGCVIVDRDGRRLSEAATGDGGRPHAEHAALMHLPQGVAAGGTAYVTLEPCHERSTGEASCSARLIEAGLVRIVVATRDKHPQGDGGLSRLREAGIQVETGLFETEALRLYEGFFAKLD